MIGEIWNLGDSDWELARRLAIERKVRNSSQGCHDRMEHQMGKVFAGPAAIWSIGAEIAFCDMFGLSREHILSEERLDWDAVMPDRRSVDVKCKERRPGGDEMLIVNRSKLEHPADLYVLMIVEGRRFEFAGAMGKREFFRDGNLRTLRFEEGPCYCVEKWVLGELEKEYDYAQDDFNFDVQRERGWGR